ncbi:hypothetical protein [Ekhidna sp.]|uniref:hypothetical protein n=1 Tax=Ekhidna sp. TaxID=2608089 RepID=UPI003BA8A8CB
MGLDIDAQTRRILLLSPHYQVRSHQNISSEIYKQLGETNLFEQRKKSAYWETALQEDKRRILEKVDYIFKSTLTSTGRSILLNLALYDDQGKQIENSVLSINLRKESWQNGVNDAVEKVKKKLNYFDIHGQFKKPIKVETMDCSHLKDTFQRWLVRSLQKNTRLSKFHTICIDEQCITDLVIDDFDCWEEDDGKKSLILTIKYRDNTVDIEGNIDDDYRVFTTALAEQIFIKLKEIQ